jgi:hypothetical protein
MIAGSEYKDRSRGSAGLHSQPFIRSMLLDARTRVHLQIPIIAARGPTMRLRCQYEGSPVQVKTIARFRQLPNQQKRHRIVFRQQNTQDHYAQ